MKELSWYTAVTLLGLSVGLGPGCGKNIGADPKTIEAASKLPGASEVMAAIGKKDYDEAVAGLMKVKQTVTTDEQNVQFMILARQARDKISEAAATNAQAAEAVNVLRALTTGGR